MKVSLCLFVRIHILRCKATNTQHILLRPFKYTMRALTTSQYVSIGGGYFEPTMMDDEEEDSSSDSQSRGDSNKNKKGNSSGKKGWCCIHKHVNIRTVYIHTCMYL